MQRSRNLTRHDGMITHSAREAEMLHGLAFALFLSLFPLTSHLTLSSLEHTHAETNRCVQSRRKRFTLTIASFTGSVSRECHELPFLRSFARLSLSVCLSLFPSLFFCYPAFISTSPYQRVSRTLTHSPTSPRCTNEDERERERGR